ncbi:MAG: urease accessory protein UreD [Acutalibacteraceae bacterium]
MMQTASAGILKGDTQELNFDIRDNASMELVSQSYEKLHKMDGGNARRDCTIKVGKNALFKYGRFYRSIFMIPDLTAQFMLNLRTIPLS